MTVNVCLRFIFGATLTDLLAASMAAEPFDPRTCIYVQSIGGNQGGFSAFTGFVLIFDLYVFWILCKLTHITSNKLNLMKIT